MRILSIRQPWASLIIAGEKDVENRTWATAYRGPVLIHAAQAIDHAGPREAPTDLRGGIIGLVDLVDIVMTSHSQWFHGPFGWRLRDPIPLPFYPCRGQLGLYGPSDDMLNWLSVQIVRA